MWNWKCVNSLRGLPVSIPEAAWERLYTLPPPVWNLDFYTWYDAEIYTSNTSWQKMLIDDVIVLVTWPTCILKTKKIIFADVRINEKMTSSMNLSYQGELLVKDSSWYHFQIPRYCMAVNFFYNSWSVNSDHPKTRDHFAHAQKSYEGLF